MVRRMTGLLYFLTLKKNIHTRDRRYCELFLKKDPLARTDMDVLTKARFYAYIAHTHTRIYAQTHTLTHIHRCFWEPFRLGNSAAVNSVKRLISGVNPQLGFRLKKTKPLLRLVFIHTENRNVTFVRTKIYAGFLCLFIFLFLLFQNTPLLTLHTWYRFR